MKTYTLSELAAYVQRVLAMNFPEPVWVRAEILQARINRGHTYIELIQKDNRSEGVAAQSGAVLWSKQRSNLTRKMSENLDDFLREGCEVSLLVEITFHSVYGLKLSIIDLDPSYTLGRLQLNRQKTIERLIKEKLIDQNAKLPIPPVLQRIAIVSAPSAAGYQDFTQQLTNNEYGYQYHLQLFPSAMQGVNVEEELIKSLNQIDKKVDKFDCIVIIRGGGSKLDLSAFDQFEIAKAISKARLPVFTGIGHDTDQAVCDMVAHRAFKTPTAVATFLVETNLFFETKLLQIQSELSRLAMQNLKNENQNLARMTEQVSNLPRRILLDKRHMLREIEQQFIYNRQLMIAREHQTLQKISQLIKAFDPKNIMERGYVYTKVHGQIIKRISDLQRGISLEIFYRDGTLISRIENIKTK